MKINSHYLLMLLLVVLAVAGLFFVKEFTGFAGVQIPARAGEIATVLIDDRQASLNWAGVFGLVFSQSDFSETQSATLTSGTITSSTMVFTCVDPNQATNEMYASLNSTIDFSDVRAGTPSMIDIDYLNLTSTDVDRANTSFTFNESILLGSTNISNIPAVYTNVNDAPNNTKFFTGILNATGQLVLVIKIFATTQTSFKGTKVDYQAMLPIKNGSRTWYFFADPNDVCPAGLGSGQIGDSSIAGYVFEANTSLPIANVTVSAGGNSSLTNSNGFFNFTAPGGVRYELVAIKEGYVTNITTINTTIGQTTTQNMTMAKFFGFVGANSTISGHVRDNSTGTSIANATISIAGLTALSNATGNYSLVVGAGTHVLAAVKNGYNNFVSNFTISSGQNLSFFINMSAVPQAGAAEQNGTLFANGTIEGFVKDNSTNLSLAGVAVTVAGSSVSTDSAGFYNLTALEGTTNLVATKDGYNSYFKEVNITESSRAFHNFSMNPIVVSEGVGNGSVLATVKTSSGTTLSGVAVSAAGKSNTSNSSGQVLLRQIPAGTHNLVATRTGYNNYVTEINITQDQQTNVSVSMVTTTEAGLGTGSGAGKGAGSGAGKGAGSGAGRGAGTGIQAQVEQPTQIVEYEISVKKILKKLKVGNFIGVPIDITNFKEDSISLKFSVEGDIKKMARVSTERLVIEGSSSAEVMLTLLGNVEPGVYEGFFSISGDINEQIPVYVLVLEKERLSVESLVIKIIPLEKKVAAGDIFKYSVDLQNLLSEDKYKVVLTYTMSGINSNRTLPLEKEEVVIHTSLSLLKSFRIPDDLDVGDYALRVRADFLELSAEHSTIFTVVEPLYKYAVLGLVPLWVLFLLIGTLGTGTFSVIVYKKKKDEQKRYKIELDYSQLPKAGPRSAFVGNIAETANKTYFDLDLFQVHSLIAGSSGSGKSVVAQVLVEEALLKGVAVIVFDPTAQWTGFLRKLDDKKLLGLYKNYGMKKTDSKAFNGNVHLVNNARELIEFNKFMKPSEINVFVTSKLDTKDIELFVANTIRQVFHANLPESRELKYLLVYDGIHSLLPKFGGTGQVFVQIERATREFRKWGVGLILISQVLSDFPPEVLANINTEVQLRTRDEGDLNRTKEKYGDKILQSVVKAAVGAGVVQNSAYNKGKPYFVAFRPPMHGIQRISDEELENYNKFNDMIDDLEFQLEQLEKEGVDIFDLKLELKLAQDKVKSGSFNMVNIYLDGLKPRIKAQWDKLGKAPKKREIKYISESELEQELEKAKQERKKKSDEPKEEKAEMPPKEETKMNGQSEPNAEKPEPAQNPENIQNNEASTIDDLAAQIKDLASKNERQKAIVLYSKVQEIYRGLAKEEKAKILPMCIELQKALAPK